MDNMLKKEQGSAPEGLQAGRQDHLGSGSEAGAEREEEEKI